MRRLASRRLASRRNAHVGRLSRRPGARSPRVQGRETAGLPEACGCTAAGAAVLGSCSSNHSSSSTTTTAASTTRQPPRRPRSTTTRRPPRLTDGRRLGVTFPRSLQGQLVRPATPATPSDASPTTRSSTGPTLKAIAYCASAADVTSAIRFARQHDIQLSVSVRSGGHCYGGWSTGPGLVIDVSPMNQVAVARGERAGDGRIGDPADRPVCGSGAAQRRRAGGIVPDVSGSPA